MEQESYTPHQESQGGQPVAAAAAPTQTNWTIPAAILLGFGMIAGAIYFSGSGAGFGAQQQALNFDTDTPTDQPSGEIRPVDENDHIRGNPNAPIVFVEYSDYDCPFCKQFHETMKRIVDEYGADGQVAWVYRQFPLEQLHPNAPQIALASECVADLGGNDAFWTFSDLIFSERGTNEPTNMTELPGFAVQTGVDEAAFTACVEEGRFMAEVEEDLADGMNAGARGTPHTLVLVGGQQGTINGAQPYEVVKQLTENLISQIEGGN